MRYYFSTTIFEGRNAGNARACAAQVMAGYCIVDFIAALERESERAGMQNWVHLHPAGNRVLARELCATIVKELAAKVPAGGR